MKQVFYIKENQHFDGKITYIEKFYNCETFQPVNVDKLLNDGVKLCISPATIEQKEFAKKRLKNKVDFWNNLRASNCEV